MNEIVNINERLKNVINKDKCFKSDNLIGVLKSDLFDLLSNYFVINDDQMKVDIVQENGDFVFSCSLVCEKIKTLNYLK